MLSDEVPPLVLGSATFTARYNEDPFSLPTTTIVQRALELGISAFDTSPFYGPAEQLIGAALATLAPRKIWIQTKVGREGVDKFDYSPKWITKSIQRSCERLGVEQLDLVFCHDVEFVSEEDVIGAVRELRRIRETGTIRYVGISGYPVPLLCKLAERIQRETGEPLDAVMSYANFTLQNTTLLTQLPRLRAAGVDVVYNASPLGMGLLRTKGVPIGSDGDFHPADRELRELCFMASEFSSKNGEKLEVLALRYALREWKKHGSSVIGCSYVEELEETMKLWNALDHRPLFSRSSSRSDLGMPGTPGTPGTPLEDLDMLTEAHLVNGVRSILGRRIDDTW